MAGQLEITNGHAARMRFSRFKQHMEGVPPSPRRPRPVVPRHKKPKHETRADHEQRVKGDDEPAAVKPEPMSVDEQVSNVEPSTKPEPMSIDEQFAGAEPSTKPEPMPMDQQTTIAELPTKAEPIVKEERTDDDESEGMAEMTDIFRASLFEAQPSWIVKKQEPLIKSEVYWGE